MRARKEARAAKKLEKERIQAQKRSGIARRRLSAAPMHNSPPRSPEMADGDCGSELPRPVPAALGAFAPCGEPQLTAPPRVVHYPCGLQPSPTANSMAHGFLATLGHVLEQSHASDATHVPAPSPFLSPQRYLSLSTPREHGRCRRRQSWINLPRCAVIG